MSNDLSDDERDLLDLAPAYGLGAVSEADRAEIAGRLGAISPHTAREFAQIVADTQETIALVTVGDTLAPPIELREQLLRAIDEIPRADVDDLSDRRRRRVVSAVLAAAAAVVVGIGATVAIQQFDRPPSVPTVAQVMANRDTQTSTTAIAGGTITLSTSAQANAVVVKMTDVPPPPEGHVYQMWFMPPAGAPRSAGTMSATTMPPPDGTVIPALDSATRVAVTVEAGEGSPQPTGTPVVIIPIP
ncbi:anti-sigma-K factor RskA [Gordonia defluvii]|uniref:Regulator of SigK n=1 Tax=Gordonia defluvii TaxID=283718 RepID=A0ABP6KX01_9ACTN